MTKKTTKPATPIGRAPRAQEKSDAYKRGQSMGSDFIAAFDVPDAAQAISGFIDSVNEHMLNLRDKATTACVDAEAAINVLRAGAPA